MIVKSSHFTNINMITIIKSMSYSIDNFIAGSDPAVSFAPVMTASVLTGALATVACAAGAALFPLAPRRGALVSALLLTGLAVAGIA